MKNIERKKGISAMECCWPSHLMTMETPGAGPCPCKGEDVKVDGVEIANLRLGRAARCLESRTESVHQEDSERFLGDG